jgi:POT family proton-dependent oligopeptide transporter
MKPTKNSTLTAINIDDESKIKMPPGIPYIVGNEFAERFGTVGMHSIFVFFIANYLFDNAGNHLFTNPQAMALYHNYISVARFLAIIGAIIADAFWGKYKTIITFSIIYCLGYFILAFFYTK